MTILPSRRRGIDWGRKCRIIIIIIVIVYIYHQFFLQGFPILDRVSVRIIIANASICAFAWIREEQNSRPCPSRPVLGSTTWQHLDYSFNWKLDPWDVVIPMRCINLTVIVLPGYMFRVYDYHGCRPLYGCHANCPMQAVLSYTVVFLQSRPYSAIQHASLSMGWVWKWGIYNTASAFNPAAFYISKFFHYNGGPSAWLWNVLKHSSRAFLSSQFSKKRASRVLYICPM